MAGAAGAAGAADSTGTDWVDTDLTDAGVGDSTEYDGELICCPARLSKYDLVVGAAGVALASFSNGAKAGDAGSTGSIERGSIE